MSTTKTTTAKTETAKTAKTSTAKSTAKTATKEKAAKPAKAEKTPVEKKERKSRKGITRTFAAEVTSVVSPVIETVNAFINDPNTSEEALKMIRLELRKAVRGTRATLKTRKSTKA